MKLREYVDTTKLTDYIEQGLVTGRHHPKHPLTILNYSPAAQSVKNWDDTLSKCRGLVYDYITEEIHAIPFKKFWNYNDPAHPETLEINLPFNEPPVLYEKMDGSLGIGFFYKGEFIIATRGSFESEQAKWAQSYYELNCTKHTYPQVESFTFLFEIISPHDKKVVDYGRFQGLVLLGYISNKNGTEFPPGKSLLTGIWMDQFPVPARPDITLSRAAKLDIPNSEGYVATWYGANTFRVKIKFETYKKLHRMYFQTSTEVIWELMKTGTLIDYTDQIMDQPLRNWVLARSIEMASAKGKIDKEVKTLHENAMRSIAQYGNISKAELRKEFAARATCYEYPQLMFLLYDAKHTEYEEALWKIVRPKNSFFRSEE